MCESLAMAEVLVTKCTDAMREIASRIASS
jgi:hypothetical protein